MLDSLPENLRIFVDLTFDLTNVQLAEKYKKSINEIQALKDDLRNLGCVLGTGYPQSPTEDYDKYIDIKYDRVLVLGDCEIPDHDDEMFSMATDLAHKFNIKHLILNGDFVALDPFSSWPKTSTSKVDFSQQLDLVDKVIETFLVYFKTIDYVTGNHERRLPYKTEGNTHMGHYLRHLEDVTFSEYSYCFLNSGDTDIIVCHQDNFSRLSQSVPAKIAGVELKNILCGHTHRLSFGYHESSKFWTVDGGHCRDVIKTSYKARRINTFPKWNSGFVMIIDGFPYLIDKRSFNFWMNIKPTESFFKSIID